MEKVDLHWKIFLEVTAEHEWMKTEWISCLIILYFGEAVEPLRDLRYRLLINKVLQRLKLPPTTECATEHVSEWVV